jgi:hypothetical protein
MDGGRVQRRRGTRSPLIERRLAGLVGYLKGRAAKLLRCVMTIPAMLSMASSKSSRRTSADMSRTS